MWAKDLQHIVRNVSTSTRNDLVIGNRTSLLGLIQSYGGGFDVDRKPQLLKIDGSLLVCRRWKHSSAPNEPNLDRGFLAKLWVLDKQMEKKLAKRRKKLERYMDEKYEKVNVLKQPPVSQPISGYLAPTSPEEVQIAPLVARSNLLITRDIEWMNLMIGFEQANRYAIVDVCYPQSPVGFIREESNVLLRQFLRLRRPFTACIVDATGNELFRIRRPFWFVTSSIYAEVNGKHLNKSLSTHGDLASEVYPFNHTYVHAMSSLYATKALCRDWSGASKMASLEENLRFILGFAVVENPGFWNWTFTLKDIDGNVLAQIDRDWRGFGFEIFTDAGQYVIRFGSSDPASKTGRAEEVEDLEVARPLTLSERAVAVALAVSLDNDYFSRHGGWGIPLIAVAE